MQRQREVLYTQAKRNIQNWKFWFQKLYELRSSWKLLKFRYLLKLPKIPFVVAGNAYELNTIHI